MKRFMLVFVMSWCLLSLGCDSHPELNIDESSSSVTKARVLPGTSTRVATEITRVLEADAFLGKLRDNARRSIGVEALRERGEASIRQTLVENMRKIPLDGVPEEFKNAYLRHIDAWAHGSRVAISTTWMEVQAAAQRHGVVWDD